MTLLAAELDIQIYCRRPEGLQADGLSEVSMVLSGLRKPECLRVLFCLISCGLFFAVASPPAAAQFKAGIFN